MNHRSSLGTLDITDNQATLRFVRRLPHAPKKVWEAITSPAHMNLWLSATTRVEGKVGGLIDVITEQFHWTGTILAWQPPQIFVYEYNHQPHILLPQGAKTVIRWELEPIHGGTRLIFTQSGLHCSGYGPSMHASLDLLQELLARGAVISTYTERYQQVEAQYPVWMAD